MTSGIERTGGRILVDQLVLNGTDTAFCVPGESYLPVLDALYDVRERVRLITCRHEASAANMAEAYGKLTGRPGVAMVTRGPGAFHASVGVHTAAQDSTPMILFIGQVGTRWRGREAFQEVDFEKVFGDVAKWAVQIDHAERIPEIVGRAFTMAMSGRPGPVVIALPEDVLSACVTVGDARPSRPLRPVPAPADLNEFAAMLRAAERPLLVVGGAGWSGRAREHLHALSAAHGLPVVSSFRRQDLFDNDAPTYAGTLGPGVNPELARRFAESDLIVALGTRLGELPTAGYTLLEPPRPAQRLVHIHPGTEELDRVYQADLSILSGSGEFLAALTARPALLGGLGDRRREWAAAMRRTYLGFSTWSGEATAGHVDLGAAVDHLNQALPADAVITNGAGNYTIWAHRHYRFTRPRTQLAPTSGAMGYGLPAGLAAKVVHPERDVVVFAGDGCFLMAATELATAVQYGLDVIVLVVNNGGYGTIRMHQERRFPGRVSGTDLRNPDFAAFAESFGAYGERVRTTADFPDALDRARKAGRPAVLELLVDPKQLTPAMRLP